jgi:hypothetical protein
MVGIEIAGSGLVTITEESSERPERRARPEERPEGAQGQLEVDLVLEHASVLVRDEPMLVLPAAERTRDLNVAERLPRDDVPVLRDPSLAKRPEGDGKDDARSALSRFAAALEHPNVFPRWREALERPRSHVPTINVGRRNAHLGGFPKLHVTRPPALCLIYI